MAALITEIKIKSNLMKINTTRSPNAPIINNLQHQQSTIININVTLIIIISLVQLHIFYYWLCSSRVAGK